MNNKKFKKFLKKILPSPILYLYYLLKVVRIKIIKWIPTYNEDELMTGHNSDFMRDEKFMRCYNSAVEKGLAISSKIRWRAHTVCWAAEKAKDLEGDFVECGVARGFLSRIVMEYIDFNKLPKNFYLLDTFEGLDKKYLTKKEKDEIQEKYWDYGASYEKIKKTFSDFHNVKIIKGSVPETLPQVKSQKVAYLSIDMNCVIPEIAALEYFWEKLVPGAVIISDDYGHGGHDEQKKGFDDFVKRKNVSILYLPTGQGLIIKP
jgi:hypothetical protein